MFESSSPQQVWDAALGDLQIQVNKANYDTWLRNTRALSYEKGEFVVGVPSTFIAEFLERNQRSLVEKVLSGLLGGEVKVRFQISGNLKSDSSSRRPEPAQQGSLPLFNPRYTFDSFIAGKSNQLAYAAAMTVAHDPGHSYNPLFLYGGAGLGKTHLLQAIGRTAVANNMRVLCVSAEQYTNDMVAAIRDRHTSELHQKYRGVEVLLVDDVQFFSGKQKTAENFFHTFDELHNASRQIVLTSDRPPKAIPLLPERLSSRFEWGLVTEIRPPDYETRLAILEGKSRQDGADLSPDVLEFLARQIQQNIRVLEGSLNRVVAYAKLVRAVVTPQLAAQAIKDIAGGDNSRPMVTAGRIVEAVATSFQMPPGDLVGGKRDKDTTMARRVAMYMMRQ